MAVAHRMRVVCPRCSSPIAGEFKFCPACAFRLKPGAIPPGPPDGGSRSRLSMAVLGVSAGLFVAGLAGLGLWLFRDQEPVHEGPRRVGPTLLPPEGLTLSNLRQFMRRVPEGSAYTLLDGTPEEPKPRAMQVRALDVMAYEATRGLYDEFLRDVKERLASGEGPGAVLQPIWDPQTEGERAYAHRYLHTWLTEVVRHLRTPTHDSATLPEPLTRFLSEDRRAEGSRSPRAFTDALPFPWPSDLGWLLLVPPGWLRLDPFETFITDVPEGTRDLPVTQVAWTDAIAFADWATARLGGALKLQLPVAAQWIRIAHGMRGGLAPDYADPVALWPWGRTPLFHACNNRNASAWDLAHPSGLHPVDSVYRDDDEYGEHNGGTPQRVFGMAGNAREWVLNERVNPETDPGGDYWSDYDPKHDQLVSDTPTYGGSYRLGIYDCTIFSNRRAEKSARLEDVGFRLVAVASD